SHRAGGVDREGGIVVGGVISHEESLNQEISASAEIKRERSAAAGNHVEQRSNSQQVGGIVNQLVNRAARTSGVIEYVGAVGDRQRSRSGIHLDIVDGKIGRICRMSEVINRDRIRLVARHV